MAQSAKRFAALLQEGITAVANRTAKPKGVIRDELGYAIGRKGGSALEYWCYGDGRIPQQPADVAALARALVDAGQLDGTWLTAFLESAGYPHGAALIADLFPDAVDQPPAHLPLPPTPFVGRAQELADLAHLLANADCRLITLVGPGGSGKTRLAVEAARNARNAFPDDALFVALAPLLSADLVVPTVATALHLSLAARATPQTQLLHYLRRKALLLVLDNFEHLLSPLSLPPLPSPLSSPAATEEKLPENPALRLLTEILQQAPAVTLVVTSRERLNLQGEWVYDVGGLATPESDTVASADEYSAVTLFLQTARRVQAGFAPTAADQAAIVRICRLVTGMPLAVELAAAWVRVLSCAEIADEIAASLNFLTTTLRNLPERHRSLRAVFDHSWRLLNAEEQQIFARCSVFRGGFTREAAETVAGASLPGLVALVDKSLLSRNGAGRYAIHELARQYGAERLAETGQVAQARNRHLAFFMALAEEAEPHLRSGPQIVQWYDRIEHEHDNLRAALDWSLGGGEVEPGLRIVGALWDFWMNRGYASEGQAQAERFLARPETTAPTYARAKALHTAGVLAFYQGSFPVATSLLTECINSSRALGPSGKFILAEALIGRGYIALGVSDFDSIATLNQELLLLGQELQNTWVRGHAMLQLGYVARANGNDAQAQQNLRESFDAFRADGQSVMRGLPALRLGELLYEQKDYVTAGIYLNHSLAIFEELGDPSRSCMALSHLGKLAMAQDDRVEVQRLLTKALLIKDRTAYLHALPQALDCMGRLAQWQGNYPQAHAFHETCLLIWGERETHQTRHRVLGIEAFACLAARQGQLARAALLFGAAETLFAETPMQWNLLSVLQDPVLRAEHDRLLAHTRAQLGEAAFVAAWAAGVAMDLDQAVKYALDTAPAIPSSSCAW